MEIWALLCAEQAGLWYRWGCVEVLVTSALFCLTPHLAGPPAAFKMAVTWKMKLPSG